METLGWRVTFEREPGGKATRMTVVDNGGQAVQGRRKP